jgi:hypothetical protein
MVTRVIFIVIAVGLVVAGLCAYYHDESLRKYAPQVNLGDSKEVVEQLMGNPSSVEECGALTPVPKSCSDEYVYHYWYSIFQPEYEVIWFDQTGKVLGEQRVRSSF